MKIISLNVNGLKSCLEKGLKDKIFYLEPDIVCFQEIKCQEKIIKVDNYYDYWSFCNKKGYSGVAVFSKLKPIRVIDGFILNDFDTEGRLLTLEYEKFILINVYVPNSKSSLSRVNYRMSWDDSFYAHINHFKSYKPLIMCGDFNIDLKKINDNGEFIDNEINIFQDILDLGYIDSFLYKHPNDKNSYTWNNIAKNNNNVGYRLDYFIVPYGLKNKIINSNILDNIHCSDHLPIILEIEY